MYDVIVVGSGAGGASCALMLAKAGLECLVLEEGPDTQHPPAPISQVESFQRYWRNGAFTGSHFGAPQLSYAEGRCAGGSTTVNSGILQSIPAPVRKRMADDGLGAFEPDFYGETEAELLARLPVEYDRNRSLSNPTGLLVNVLERMGHDPVHLPRWTRECAAENRCSTLCPRGAKPGAKGTFLVPFTQVGGQVAYDTRVERFRMVPGGVEVTVRRSQGQEEILRARHLVLAAGATQTPQLVMRSRIEGNRRGTRFRLGVHPTLKINGFMAHEQPNFLANRLPLAASSTAYPNYRIGGGVVNPEVYSYITATAEGAQHLDQRNFFSYYVMGHSDSYLDVRYWPTLDMQLATARIGAVDRYSIQAGAARFMDAIASFSVNRFLIQTSKGTCTFEDARSATRFVVDEFTRCLLTTVHIFGSLDDQCFDSQHGRPFLAGTEGRVTISDASLMTRPPGVNTQLGVLVIGHWVAAKILEKYKK